MKKHGSEIRKSEANNLQLDLYCNKKLLFWALALILNDFIYKFMVSCLKNKYNLNTLTDSIAAEEERAGTLDQIQRTE